MPIVIVGSGLAGVTLAESLRSLMPDCAIQILTQESSCYYARPMLSHGFSLKDIENKIRLKSFDDLRSQGIEVLHETQVQSLHPSLRELRCRTPQGEVTLGYEKLVLAQGSTAFIPESFHQMDRAPRVLNSLDDLMDLKALRAETLARGIKPHWAVIGGGLIGCELASDFAKAGDAVSLFHPLPRLMERQLEASDSEALLAVLQNLGVTVHLETPVRNLKGTDHCVELILENSAVGPYTAPILCTGFRPRTELAQQAGLKTHRGIVVNAWLTTSDPAIFAVGDAAECPESQIFAYVLPIRHQAQWLARHLAGLESEPWVPPVFKPRAKVHGFAAVHPYQS